MKMKRVFLKLNREVLADPKKTGFDEGMVKEMARQVKLSVDAGIWVGIVIDGGNFWRGRTDEAINGIKADQIGILATVMNCIYVSEIFRNANVMTQILTPFVCGSMIKLFSKGRANKYFERDMAVFFASGTGHPYFSTDTRIALRAIRMEADCILLARATDGVYNSDPKLDPGAKKYDATSIQKVINKQLAVVDLVAPTMCMEHKMPMAVLNLNEKNGTTGAIQGRISGTIVTA